MKQNRTSIFIMLLLIILGLSACSPKIDTELNNSFSPLNNESTYYYQDSQYYWYYRDKFQNLPIDTVLLSMGLDWFVKQYNEIYTGESDFFYISSFDTPNISTYDLTNLYNNDTERYDYLKPFLDCYLLMDKNQKPSEDDLKAIKKTILYALDYYICGKDFVGTLD